MSDVPWWQRQVPWLSQRLLRLALQRAPSADAHDLVQESLATLSRSLAERKQAFPVEWNAADAPEDEGAQRAALWRFSKRVLERRTVDRLRKHARHWSYLRVEQDVEALPANTELATDALFRRELIAACIDALARLPADQRELLLMSLQGVDLERAMTPAERKQLSRARQRVANWISKRLRAEFGENALDWL